MNSARLPEHPSQIVDRSSVIQLYFNGRPVPARRGDTVASALYAAGRRIFSRSFKYHRPRGLLCVSGRCANCLMMVDGVPNVRSCTETVREGMRVRHQNARPSLDHDLLSVLDRLSFLMPVGFYYKTLIHPRFAWRLASRVIRHIAGLGEIDIHREYDNHYEHHNAHTDVAVVGGGPAGISAALEVARSGLRVTLIDDQPSLGGHLRAEVRDYPECHEHPEMRGFEIAQKLSGQAADTPNIEIISGATVFGLYEGHQFGILHGRRMIKLRAKRVVVATGSQEVPQVFQGNDLPGVILGTGVKRLMHLYGVKPGDRAVVATASDEGYTDALQMQEAGIHVAAVLDSRSDPSIAPGILEQLGTRGVAILPAYTIKEARGVKRVRQAVAVSHNGGRERRFRCDLVCVSGWRDPAASLLFQAGSRLRYDEALGETVPFEMPSGLYAAGDVTGIHDLEANLLQGRLAGLEAAADLLDAQDGSHPRESAADHQKKVVTRETQYRERVGASRLRSSSGSGKKSFVCPCEDVTDKDLLDAIAEGFDEMQTLKRYSTVSMGPCQGKMCLKAAVEVCAHQTGLSIDDTGTTTSRPPLHPVPLGALAGPSHMPIKRTPMDRQHRALGARMMDLGPWKRPFAYGDPMEECRAVHERVGIIDVSTLGKLDVRGRDAPALLDKVYTHIFSSLAVGRIRYGLLCSDNGNIIDDGTITRLAEDHYFITTTTGNVDLMEEWLKWWAAGTGWCVHVNNVTPAYAAINVAGPRARDTLKKLTDVDLSTDKFRYMRSARGEVAGVPSLLLRIGFVGEAGWEVHFPAEYGEHMWDVLMEAGKEFGIAPFGVEAQRILRLEKKHVIIGQDTDLISNPLEGDMAWVVRFEKDDFIGKEALKVVQQRGLREKLVGFVMEDGALPEDGVPVVSEGKPIGRVTSARRSPTSGRGFGFVWVPVEFSEDGSEIQIQINGRPTQARVHSDPIYDPKGTHLRE